MAKSPCPKTGPSGTVNLIKTTLKGVSLISQVGSYVTNQQPVHIKLISSQEAARWYLLASLEKEDKRVNMH